MLQAKGQLMMYFSLLLMILFSYSSIYAQSKLDILYQIELEAKNQKIAYQEIENAFDVFIQKANPDAAEDWITKYRAHPFLSVFEPKIKSLKKRMIHRIKLDYLSEISKEWAEVKDQLKYGPEKAIEMIDLFLVKYQGQVLKNPYEMEARNLIQIIKSNLPLPQELTLIDWKLIDAHYLNHIAVRKKNTGFYVSAKAITVKQYFACVADRFCSMPHWDDLKCQVHLSSTQNLDDGRLDNEFRDENQPILCIDLQQAKTFSKWVGGDLPTDEQRKYIQILESKVDDHLGFRVIKPIFKATIQSLFEQQNADIDKIFYNFGYFDFDHHKKEKEIFQASANKNQEEYQKVYEAWLKIKKNILKGEAINTLEIFISQYEPVSFLKPLIQEAKQLIEHIDDERKAYQRLQLEQDWYYLSLEAQILDQDRALSLVKEWLHKNQHQKFKNYGFKPLKQIDWVKIQGNHKIPSFYISQSEINIGEYNECIKDGACTPPHWHHCYHAEFNDYRPVKAELRASTGLPVICVDWQQAQTFAKWAGGDLLSESQWEYAATSRGKDLKSIEVSCRSAVIKRGLMDELCGHRRTEFRCSKPMGNTEQGVCDMIGNLREWVLDDDQVNKISKGGSWNEEISGVDLDQHTSAKIQANHIGFRIMRPVYFEFH